MICGPLTVVPTMAGMEPPTGDAVELSIVTVRLGTGELFAMVRVPTVYEYDGLDRLLLVRDKDGNIVKHLEYHYQR